MKTYFNDCVEEYKIFSKVIENIVIYIISIIIFKTKDIHYFLQLFVKSM